MKFKPGEIVIHTIAGHLGHGRKNKYIILDKGYKNKFVKVYCLGRKDPYAGRIFHFKQNSLTKYKSYEV